VDDWRFVAALPSTPNSVVALGELTEAHDRKITWRLTDACDASFTIDARHELATLVDELTVDLVVYHGDQRVFRGRLGTSGDDVDPDAHTLTLTAVDYTGILDRRILRPPQAPWVFANVAQGSIVLQLLVWTGFQPGGAAVGVGSLPATSMLRTITFDPGKPIGEAIDDLAKLEQGFDWWVDHDLLVSLASPQRGVERDLTAEYGSTVTAVQRQFDPAEYANAVMVTGKEGVAPKFATVPDLATRREGRIDIVESFPDIDSPTVLQARANQALTERSTVRPAYTCTMTPGVWTPGALWLGDVTWLVIRSGRLNLSRPERVTQIEVTVSDAGAEDVRITFGTVPAKLASRIRNTARRLDRLERLGA
jgi:hypothetical protein